MDGFRVQKKWIEREPKPRPLSKDEYNNRGLKLSIPPITRYELSLNEDLWLFILSLCTVKEVILLSKTCYVINELTREELSSLLYSKASSKIPTQGEIGRYKTYFDLYIRYCRGKSYGIRPKERIFQLRGNERILCGTIVNMCNSEYTTDRGMKYPTGYFLTTIDSNGRYKYYIFCPVVNIFKGYTPDYFEWEEEDLNVLELTDHVFIYCLDNIKRFIFEKLFEVWSFVEAFNR